MQQSQREICCVPSSSSVHILCASWGSFAAISEPFFVRNFIFFSSFQLFSLCASPCVGIMGRFPCFLLSVLSWRVCSLVFFFFSCPVLSCLFCFLVLSIFDTDTRLCKAPCPHPGKLVYLTYLSYLFVSAFLSYLVCSICLPASLLSFLLLACHCCSLGFSAFLSWLFCFRFFSSLVSFLFSFIYLYFLLSGFLLLFLYQPGVVHRRSGSSIASFDKLSAA